MSTVAHNLQITDKNVFAPTIQDFSKNYEYVVVVEDYEGREHCLVVHPESDRLVAVLRAARAMALEKGIKAVTTKEILLCREPF